MPGYYIEGKTPRIKQSMNDVPTKISPGSSGAMKNQSRMHSLTKRTWRSILPAIQRGRCVPAPGLGIFPR